MNKVESATYPRTTLSLRFSLDAPVETVFPLLCPVREYDWIETWRCELLHSRSGLAENDCIFRTTRPDGSHDVWVVSRYEPPRRIEFVVHHPRVATRLDLSLHESEGRCLLDWDLRLSALVPMAEAELTAMAQARREVLTGREAELRHYLRTGTRLVA